MRIATWIMGDERSGGVVGEPDVDLAEAIEAVRAELIEAQRDGRGKALSFMVGRVVIELSGEIKTTGSAGVGAKFWVVSVDAKGERSAAASHKVTVELIPESADGSSWKVQGGGSAPTPD